MKGPELNDTLRIKRLRSLDFLRGLVMVLLALESAGLYDNLYKATSNDLLRRVISQFFHHPWHGLHFWDLIQPAFMYMAGVAMAFSLHRQEQDGLTWNASFKKILQRCGWLFFWGVLDYAVRPTGLSLELWDVLTQLSFTTLVAFLVFRWRFTNQVLICAGILLLTEFLYRFTNIAGYNEPFTDQHNFGNYMDLLVMHKINKGGWVAINCLPTAVHTIAGALTGKLLLRGSRATTIMLLWAVICLVIGFALDGTGIVPMIKRIATSSFTIVSLGFCLLGMAACYWWIDIRHHKKNILFFTIVGMNSLFIYLFFEIIGDRWFNGYAGFISNGLLALIHTPEKLSYIISSVFIFSLEWSLCYFLYRKKIFFRI